MKRSTPIKRHARLSPRRRKPRRLPPGVVRDPAHLDRIRSLPCICRSMPGAKCRGLTQASHRDEGKGGGRKTSDLETVPMCAGCHDSWGKNDPGPFRNWPRDLKRAWFVAAIKDTHLRLGIVNEQGAA